MPLSPTKAEPIKHHCIFPGPILPLSHNSNISSRVKPRVMKITHNVARNFHPTFIPLNQIYFARNVMSECLWDTTQIPTPNGIHPLFSEQVNPTVSCNNRYKDFSR